MSGDDRPRQARPQPSRRDAGPRVTTTITVPDPHVMVGLLGTGDAHLRLVEQVLASDIHVRGNKITVTGAPADNALAEQVFSELLELLAKGETLTEDAVRRTVAMLAEGTGERPAEVLTLNIVSRRGRTIRPKTLGQKQYVDAIDRHTVIFGIGPAGTGKTYLAMAKAVQALQAKQVNRIILTRPAVKAGERLGFLPGTLYEKIDPYLRPLYDALHDMIDPESIPRLMAAGTIEVAPLAYMRGRAQPVDAPVLTPQGWRPIGKLAVGDLVVGANGLPTPVLGVFPQGRRPVYRVVTQDGASTVACAEHLWSVRTADGEGWRVVRTEEMVGRLRRGGAHRFELPLAGPVEFVAQDVPLDPYGVGMLLAEGPATAAADPAAAPEAGSAEPEPGAGVADAPPPAPGGQGGVRVATPATPALPAVGVAGTELHTTFVPAVYLWNSAAVRLAVLQGLLDGAGAPVTERGRTCLIRYATCSERLRDDVVFLVRSLGGVARWRRRAASDGPAGHRRDAFVLDIRLPPGLSPFRLAGKRARYDDARGGRPARFVESIEPAGAAETTCIQVAAQDSLYVTGDLIVTHNTLNDAFIILDEAQNTTPEQMRMFLTRLGFGSRIVVTGDVTQVDLPGGTRSGLRVVQEILSDVADVHFSRLGSQDVVRHRLVTDIVDAYARWDAAQDDDQPGPPADRPTTRRPRRR